VGRVITANCSEFNQYRAKADTTLCAVHLNSALLSLLSYLASLRSSALRLLSSSAACCLCSGVSALMAVGLESTVRELAGLESTDNELTGKKTH